MNKIHRKRLLRSAFTLMELAFVIVVVGILAAVIIPRTTSNRLHEAATQLVSHIRYTQHLAMMDDKFDVNDNDWHMEMWQIRFTDGSADSDNEVAYVIFSDSSHGMHPEKSECAHDPLSGLLINGGVINDSWDDKEFLHEANLGKSFGINGINFTSSCKYYGSMRIAFDHLGRPIKGNISSISTPINYTHALKLITDKCIISLCLIDDCSAATDEQKVEVAIEPETGYVYIKQ